MRIPAFDPNPSCCSLLPQPMSEADNFKKMALLGGVGYKWKDYRAQRDARYKRMMLDADEFTRRFLMHVLPDGFRRIRHYGLFANGGRGEHRASPSAAQRTGATERIQ